MIPFQVIRLRGIRTVKQGPTLPGIPAASALRKTTACPRLKVLWFSLLVLGLSGCATTTTIRHDGLNPGAADTAHVVRLQNPGSEGSQAAGSLPVTALPPPLPDPIPPAISPGGQPAPLTPGPPAPAPSTVPADAASAGAPVPVGVPAADEFRGLSSIARNRLANRVPAAAPAASNAAPSSSPTAGPGTREPSSGTGSPILRNRLRAFLGDEEIPQFTYPDIHTEPARLYHERFGLEEEHDAFLFPWLMTLIFEDRWLLAERNPDEALKNQLRRRLKIDIRDPDPDTANFPNGAYTLPKGRMYIENSPLGLYSGSRNGSQPQTYQWGYLLRYGLTDNLEFRLFSNGLTYQAGPGTHHSVTGYSPLAFDFKANFWEENTRYHIPAMGIEVYIQTTFGSPALNNGTQPSLNLLFDQSLPFEIGFEYNFGITGVQNNAGQIVYQFSYQWSFQRQVVKDFDIFFQGFYNAAALPSLLQFRSPANTGIPNVTALGLGAIWTVNDRLAIFGSYNFGVTPASPKTIALLGFAVGF